MDYSDPNCLIADLSSCPPTNAEALESPLEVQANHQHTGANCDSPSELLPRESCKTPANASAREIPATKPSQRKCTGPTTAEGKRISSRNALKHGAFSKEIVQGHILEPKDRRKYTQILNGLLDVYKPLGQAELFQLELMAIFAHKFKKVLRLSRMGGEELGGLIPGSSTESNPHSNVVLGWLDSPPIDLLEKIHRAEAHCLNHYNRAAAELERLQRLRMGEKVLPRIAVDVNT